jgi:dephospho-CoA kinase
MSNKAVAVVGMCGSGKSAVCGLFEARGWQKVYFGGVTVSELKRQGIAINEKNERAMRESLRRKFGMGAYALLLKEEIAEKLKAGNTVLDGVYSWSEYIELVKNLGDDLVVLAVVSNADIRHKRLVDREVRPLTEEAAKSRDHAEIEHLEKGGPIAIADYYIVNNGSMGELERQFSEFVDKI